MPVSPPLERVRRPRPRGPVGWFFRGLQEAPATVGFIVIFWLLGALSSGIFHGLETGWRDGVAATAHSFPDHWWAVLSCGFWANDLRGYVLGTVFVLLAGIPLERQLGSLKFSFAAMSAQVAGVVAATAVWAATNTGMGSWAAGMNRGDFLGPSALICGTVLAGTASLGALWRRRIRVGLFGLLILLALYSGGFPDLVRLGAGGAGALLGPALLRRRPLLVRPVSSRHEGRVLIALLVAISAVGPVVSGLVPHAAGPLSMLRFLFTDIQPVDAQSLRDICAVASQHRECEAAHLQLRAGAGGIFMAIVPSFLLLLFSEGLRRGRRFAWTGVLLVQAGLSLLALTTLVGVLQSAGPDTVAGELVDASQTRPGTHPLTLVVPLLLPVLLLGVLLAFRALFPVAAPRGTYSRLGMQVLGLAWVLSVVYVVGGLALASGFAPVPGPAALVADVPDRFLPLGFTVDVPPAFFPQSTPAVLLYEGVGTLFWAVAGVLVLRTFLRPAPARHGDDKDRAVTILKTHEGSSISWMTTWSGNSYWFSGSGESFIAYRVIAGVALTLGGPVGPAAQTDAVVEEFALHCRANGWTPCLYSVPVPVRDAATALGWESAQVAQETVLPLDSLSFKGKKFQDIRTAMNNAAKTGINAEWVRYPTAHRNIRAQILSISEEWVADRKTPEMGFTLGGLDELNDPEVRCLLAIDGGRQVHAVTSWLPVYRHGKIIGWTLDVMRRRSTGFRPAIEFLIASAAVSLKAEGCDFISLSGAPLARVTPEDDPGTTRAAAPATPGLDRLLDGLGSALEPVYGFRSLLAFKGKFHPSYIPFFMVYPDSAALPGIANALTRAYLPGISLRDGLQLLRRLLNRRVRAPGG